MNKAEAHHDGHSTKVAVLKVSYLLVVTAVTFMVSAFSTTRPAEWFVIPALLALQAIVLLAYRIDPYEIVRPVWRLKWLFVFLSSCTRCCRSRRHRTRFSNGAFQASSGGSRST